MFNPFPPIARTWREFADDHCTLLAGAIAYQVLFSFVPLVTFLIAIFGFVMRDPAAQQNAADRVLALLPIPADSGNSLVLDSIRSVARQSGTLSVIGLIGIIWSSSGIFGTIRTALNIAWGVKAKRGFVLDTLLDLGAVLGLGILFGASLAGTVMLHELMTSVLHLPGLASPGMSLVLGLVVPAAFSFTAFLLLYRYVPNVPHDVGDVWPAALFAAVLFEAGKHGFAFYVAHFNRYQALYGALGAVMLFMLWTYLSSIILLIGAELGSEFDRRSHEPPWPESPSLLAREGAR